MVATYGWVILRILVLVWRRVWRLKSTAISAELQRLFMEP